MGIVLPPMADIDAALERSKALPSAEYTPQAGLTPTELINEGAKIGAARDAHNDLVEEHGGSITQSIFGHLKYNTGLGSLISEGIQDAQVTPEPDFNPDEAIKSIGSQLPYRTFDETEYLKESVSSEHLRMRVDELLSKRDLQINNEALGVLPTFTLGLLAEIANPPNWISLNGINAMKNVSKVAKGAYLAAGQGAINYAEEKIIGGIQKDRTQADYAAAFVLGAGFGYGSSLLGRSSTPDQINATKAQLDRIDNYVKRTIDDSVAEDIAGPQPIVDIPDPVVEKQFNQRLYDSLSNERRILTESIDLIRNAPESVKALRGITQDLDTAEGIRHTTQGELKILQSRKVDVEKKIADIKDQLEGKADKLEEDIRKEEPTKRFVTPTFFPGMKAKKPDPNVVVPTVLPDADVIAKRNAELQQNLVDAQRELQNIEADITAKPDLKVLEETIETLRKSADTERTKIVKARTANTDELDKKLIDNINAMKEMRAYKVGSNIHVEVVTPDGVKEVKVTPDDQVIPVITNEQVFLQAVEEAEQKGLIPQESKLPQEYLGLAGMGQSVLRSKNPHARYLGNVMLEHPEKSGFKQHTVALEADMDFHRVFSHYAPYKVEMNGIWAKEGKSLGYTIEDFNTYMARYIDGGVMPDNFTPKMLQVMDSFKKVYMRTNESITKLCQEAGVPEFNDFNPKSTHLFRRYNTEAFHDLSLKYGAQAVKNTLAEAIRRGNIHAFASGSVHKELTDQVVDKMAEAIYNRMMKRATANTADANLLSTGNRRLLKDALDDVNLTDAERQHIDYILDTAGRDYKNNPMAKQIIMDLDTKVGNIAVTDLMFGSLDDNFMQAGRYWIGRAAFARKGKHLSTEHGIDECIDVANKNSVKYGQSADEAQADYQRLIAGKRMIFGQPVDPAELGDGWQKAVRYVRQAVGMSSLGKMGLVQFGESGRALAQAGVSQAMFLPELAGLMKSIVTGKIDSVNLRDIEDFAIGDLDTMVYLNHPMFRMDEYSAKTSKIEKGMQTVQHFMSKASGWNRVARMQQAWFVNKISNKWYREIMNGTMKVTQMADLGVSNIDLAAIKKQMQMHSKEVEGLSPFSKRVHLNLREWEPGVRRQFGLMIHRKTKNAVQGIMAGETPMWLNGTVGKFLGQFRQFSVAALGKQTTHDLKMLSQGDLEGALALQFMLATSTMATLAKIGYASVGLQGKERQKYLDEQLALPKLTASVMSYTGSLSPLVDLGSSATQLLGIDLGGQRQFATDGSPLGLIPGVNFVNKAARAGRALVKAPVEGIRKTDARAMFGILPGQTLWGVDFLTKQVIDNFED